MPDYDSSIGAEVGGPIIKDRLFFWAGFAPRFENTHVFRQTYVQQYDPATMGAKLDAAGNPIQVENTFWRARIPESRQTYYYAATLDFIPRPEHHLTVAAMGTPSFNTQMRSLNGIEFISNPAWAQERLTKATPTSPPTGRRSCTTTTGRSTRWPASTPSTSTIARPNGTLNDRNQLEYRGANLWDLEGAPGCEPIGSFQPCPVDNYHTGGFGLTKKATGARYMADLKSTHLFEAGGHHEMPTAGTRNT